jgi:hypothetical protein
MEIAPDTCDAITTIKITGVPELNKNSDNIVLYPNPANSVLYVYGYNSAPKLISLISVDGRLIKQYYLENKNSIDISAIAKGLYLVKIEINRKDNHLQVFKKLIIY